MFDGYPGLRLTATRNYRTWIYRYKSPVNGAMRQTKLGRWPVMSFHAAVVEWEQHRQAREAGQDVAAEKRAQNAAAREVVAQGRELERNGRYTVRKLMADYVGHVSAVRKAKGAKEVERLFRTMAEPIADLAPAEVKRSVAFDLIAAHLKTPVVAADLRAELGGAWDYALDSGRIDEDTPNWWRLILRGKLRSKGKIIKGAHTGNKVERDLSEEELRKLLAWLDNFSRNVRDVLTLYLWTGTRGSEIVQIAAEEITVEGDDMWWTCPKQKTKNAWRPNAVDHRVPLVGRARKIIERRLQATPTGNLFPPVSYNAKEPHILQKSIGVAVYYHMPDCAIRPEHERPRLTVTNWAPHDLRRTVRTMLAAMGCEDKIAEAIIGHMNRNVYNKYQYDRERLDWLSQWSSRLESFAA